MKFRQIRSALSIVEFAGVRFLIDPMLGDKYEYPPIPMTVNCAPGTPTSRPRGWPAACGTPACRC